ncbi:flagellar hook protein FlgE [Massilia sp. YIM B02763]|uniref:flagellar hook protein FlgE n=1 Tax=Massilia sp. YIM B02763 TaxID=3050130 RepID=UPI0025B72498|nr:flagellar hook protein FlgE [Massilia sp. YIM B02763]MDN4052631.1 flagellar hook protein FlgE [Massilia sp. YIM B02763]
MSFQQGLSGLNGAAKSLDVIGNNIANASTVGFKGSTTQFADVYARSLNGAGGKTAGIGVSVADIAQQFTQGNIETSNNPLDIAINGSGFFRMETDGLVQYSRNGQFSLDRNGYIVNAQGAKLTGYGVGANNQILAGTPQPLQINTADLKPVTTTKVETAMNLDSRTKPPTKVPFNADDPETYNKQIPVQVYDTLGNAHTMSMYYVKTDAGTWDVYAGSDGVEITSAEAASASQADADSVKARADWLAATKASPLVQADVDAAAKAYADAAGKAVTTAALAAIGNGPNSQAARDAAQAAITAAAGSAGTTPGITPEQIDAQISAVVSVPGKPVGTLKFDSNGALSTALMGKLDPPQTLPLTINLPINPPTGAKDTMTFTLNFAGTTQYGSDTSEKKTVQDGYTAGRLQRFSTADDGTILGQYSNGQTKALGQVVLANFTNPNGLEPLGNNAWAESAESGTPQVGTPDSGSFGVLQSAATEASNVDLTAELVNMITAQRVYQANAQTIKTQDSVLQTLVNLR